MVGDITYIATWEGWGFLATVIDCATRKVIGWAMDDNYKTPLIAAAIEMAARNADLPAGAIFHSDRGSNYTSAEFAAVLESLGSASRSADRLMLRQCTGGIVQRRDESRAGAPDCYPTRKSTGGYCTVHRDPLQSESPPFSTRLGLRKRPTTST